MDDFHVFCALYKIWTAELNSYIRGALVALFSFSARVTEIEYCLIFSNPASGKSCVQGDGPNKGVCLCRASASFHDFIVHERLLK